MWEPDDSKADTKLFAEYLLEYSAGDLEAVYFPTLEEFDDILKWLPCWKDAGPDRIFNFFIKKIRSIHGPLYNIIKDIYLKNETPEEWFYKE
ncbi:hypothetical protein [Clostridium sp.]|uniref:hypothetical protein n=1 Tax=Clostridium sp. TaxID=1506 RepID=UPI003F68049E